MMFQSFLSIFFLAFLHSGNFLWFETFILKFFKTFRVRDSSLGLNSGQVPIWYLGWGLSPRLRSRLRPPKSSKSLYSRNFLVFWQKNFSVEYPYFFCWHFYCINSNLLNENDTDTCSRCPLESLSTVVYLSSDHPCFCLSIFTHLRSSRGSQQGISAEDLDRPGISAEDRGWGSLLFVHFIKVNRHLSCPLPPLPTPNSFRFRSMFDHKASVNSANKSNQSVREKPHGRSSRWTNPLGNESHGVKSNINRQLNH